MPIENLSAGLLLRVKRHEPVEEAIEALRRVSFPDLALQMDTDARKRAFWINLYNAFFQILYQKGAHKGSAIFRKKSITVGGNRFSLDDIEHGILRRNRLKWSLGYCALPFPPAHLRRLAVEKVDYRIHFALNCGARSCPPIAFYSSERIEQQLESAMLSFLSSETEIDPATRTVAVSRLFLWYLGDFGGKKGIRRILSDTMSIDTSGMRIVFQPYDWTPKPDHFS